MVYLSCDEQRWLLRSASTIQAQKINLPGEQTDCPYLTGIVQKAEINIVGYLQIQWHPYLMSYWQLLPTTTFLTRGTKCKAHTPVMMEVMLRFEPNYLTVV